MMQGGKRGSRRRNSEDWGSSEDEGNELEVVDDSNELDRSGSGRSRKKWWRRALDVLMTNYETSGSNRFGRNYNFMPLFPYGKFVIHPDSWRYMLWTHFLLIWAVYSSFFTPLEFGFFRGLPENLFLLDIAGQIVFLIDIVVRFFVAYRDPISHSIVHHRSLIAKRYLKSRFTVDFLGCLPWDAIYKACGRKELVRYMLWIRLSRALRVTEFFERLEKDIRINYLFTRIVKLLAVELYCTHTAACIFYYLATTIPVSQEGYTWIGSLQMGNYRYSHFREVDLWKRYITSLYFAIVTMATLGYGDIHAVNVREMIFIMIYVSFDMILGAYLLGNMTALIVKGSKTERFRDRMTELIKYMDKYNLGKQIRNEVKNHLLLQYSYKYTEATVLQDIPSSIRAKIQQKLYEPLIKKVPLFKGCSPVFIKQIAIRVCEELFLPGEVIIEQEASVEELYVFCHGKLEGLKIEDDKDKIFPIQLEFYSTLGDVQILSNTTLHYTIKAFELCKLLRLDKQSFQDLLEIYFSDGRTILNNLLEGKESNFTKKILESDITLHITNHETELAMRVNCAAYDGDLNRLKRMICAGADPRMTDYNGRSPLHIAASKGYEEITSFLIDQGVDIHNLDKFGSSPLLEAIKNGHDQVASLLAKAGATLAIDDAGDFLCITVARREVDLLKKLLVGGINPNVKNYDYRTPLHIAASEGLYSMARLLLEAGASVFSKDRWGNTSLDEAYLSGNINLIKLLKDARLSMLSESDDFHPLQGHMPKRKCIIFPFHPLALREVERRHGIVIWIPQTMEELIKEVKEKLNITTGICIWTENGAKVTEVETISDEQNLFLAEDECSV